MRIPNIRIYIIEQFARKMALRWPITKYFMCQNMCVSICVSVQHLATRNRPNCNHNAILFQLKVACYDIHSNETIFACQTHTTKSSSNRKLICLSIVHWTQILIKRRNFPNSQNSQLFKFIAFVCFFTGSVSR